MQGILDPGFCADGGWGTGYSTSASAFAENGDLHQQQRWLPGEDSQDTSKPSTREHSHAGDSPSYSPVARLWASEPERPARQPQQLADSRSYQAAPPPTGPQPVRGDSSASRPHRASDHEQLVQTASTADAQPLEARGSVAQPEDVQAEQRVPEQVGLPPSASCLIVTSGLV